MELYANTTTFLLLSLHRGKINRINEEVEVEEEEQKKIVEEEGNQDCEGGGKINIVEREEIQE